jgi:predicted hotdog family 3-hydroxylacyl-ACP dehydratase
MCLLDEVLEWSVERVLCRAVAPHAADHPLAAHGRLGIACGIEYAAQTIAVHGVLAAEQAQVPARAGLLASVRDVRFDAARLDETAGALYCTARYLVGDPTTVVYEFSVECGDGAEGRPLRPLLAGRATIALQDFGTVTP